MGVKERAKELLDEVDGVLACRRVGSSHVPHLFTSADIDEIDEEMPGDERYPMAALARRMTAAEPGLKLAVVARGCDERALMELGKQEQLDPSDVKIIGVACDQALATECGCQTPYPSVIDAGSKTGSAGSGTAGSLIEKLDAMSSDDRLAYWLAQFGACIKCEGCRNICPMCYCKECALDNEELVGHGEVPPVGPVFHLIRAMDMAGRCIDCGLCEEACPMGIPLRSLYRKVGDLVEDRFDYRPGRDAEEKSPLAILGTEEDLK